MYPIVALVLAVAPHAEGPQKKTPSIAEPYRAYWLIRSDPRERAGYETLLITRGPLEKLDGLKQSDEEAEKLRAKVKRAFVFDEKAFAALQKEELEMLVNAKALVVDTYKRDSIWNLDGRPFKLVKSIGKVDTRAGKVMIEGREARFEEAPAADLLRLIEQPNGKMAIHRIVGPLVGAESFAKTLQARLKEQLKKPGPEPEKGRPK